MASTTANGAPGYAAAPSEPRIPWIPVAWVFSLLVLCYLPVLIMLVRQWNNDEDMGHGFFVPAVAGFIAWKRRSELFDRPLAMNWWGLGLMAWAAVQLLFATLGAELFLARTAFVFSVIGCVLFLGGMRAIRILALPLFMLFFMVPLPAIIYNQITFPLQLLASQVAERVLSLLGIVVLREGNILELPSQRLSVVEACSGIRSLLSLSFLSLVYAYFFDSKVWMRPVLLLSTIPIAIIANAGRVTFTGVLSEIRPDLAQGFFHSASGWVIFMVALLMLVLFHGIVNRIYHARKKRGDVSQE
jgi:exosortase